MLSSYFFFIVLFYSFLCVAEMYGREAVSVQLSTSQKYIGKGKQLPKKNNLGKKTKVKKNHAMPASKRVIVKNKITDTMLHYKHVTGTYAPSFNLTVNGKKIEQGKQEEIMLKDNSIEVRYDYSFLNGLRTGTKIVSCEVEKGTKDVDIMFSWNDEYRIKAIGARPKERKSGNKAERDKWATN